MQLTLQLCDLCMPADYKIIFNYMHTIIYTINFTHDRRCQPTIFIIFAPNKTTEIGYDAAAFVAILDYKMRDLINTVMVILKLQTHNLLIYN